MNDGISEDRPARGIRRILVPTDFGEVSNQALEYGIRIARKNGASITLLHVIDLDLHTPDIGPANWGEIHKELVTKAENGFQKIQCQYGKRVLFDMIIQAGFAFEVIPDLVIQRKIDLVVVGQRSHRWWDIFRRRTVSRISETCACPVFVVLPPAGNEAVSNEVSAVNSTGRKRGALKGHPLGNLSQPWPPLSLR